MYVPKSACNTPQQDIGIYLGLFVNSIWNLSSRWRAPVGSKLPGVYSFQFRRTAITSGVYFAPSLVVLPFALSVLGSMYTTIAVYMVYLHGQGITIP